MSSSRGSPTRDHSHYTVIGFVPATATTTSSSLVNTSATTSTTAAPTPARVGAVPVRALLIVTIPGGRLVILLALVRPEDHHRCDHRRKRLGDAAHLDRSDTLGSAGAGHSHVSLRRPPPCGRPSPWSDPSKLWGFLRRDFFATMNVARTWSKVSPGTCQPWRALPVTRQPCLHSRVPHPPAKDTKQRLIQQEPPGHAQDAAKTAWRTPPTPSLVLRFFAAAALAIKASSSSARRITWPDSV